MLYVNHTSVDRDALCARLLELGTRTGSEALLALARGAAPKPGASVASPQLFLDWVSTCLMDSFREGGDPAVFALLFELNRASFLHAIEANLRRSSRAVDAQDVLQEVFLNIYRYPSRFQADRADAFRGWGHRIARNTMLKFLKGQTRVARFAPIDEEHSQPEDLHDVGPERAASRSERATTVNGAYLLYLGLYLRHFQALSDRERRALSLVEVEGWSYRDTAADLGIRLENLKMVIFRGRQKIFRGMERSLAELRAGGAHAGAARRSSVPAKSLCDHQA
ncbi:MAG: RNA polymerase sigma factor [Planctomycetota bacterium]